MAPEIEWDVDTSTHNQAIVKTPPPAPTSPRHKIVWLIVVAIGITLGVAYRSIPEPPPPPTPTLRPTPTIAISLNHVIDQEARALERGDPQVFMRLQDPVDAQWRTQQINSFQKWGEPPDTSGLYTIVMSGTLTSDRVWVDINQARGGQFLRETRFYRLYNGQWFRAAPDLSFWGAEHVLRSNHFDVIFSEGDNEQAQIVAQELEIFYDYICRDLNCTLGKPIEPLTLRICRSPDCSDGGFDPNPVPQFTVILSPTVSKPEVISYTQSAITISIPSPRLSGLYFQSLRGGVPFRDEQLERMAIDKLFVPHFVAKIASGGLDRWSRSMQGDLFVGNIAQWENNRLIPIPGVIDALTTKQDLKDKVLPTLDALWAMTPPYDMSELQSNVVVEETWSVIQFIESKYGADGVAHFLNAIGPAESMSDALQNGLNVSYDDFDRAWRAWLKEQVAK